MQWLGLVEIGSQLVGLSCPRHSKSLMNDSGSMSVRRKFMQMQQGTWDLGIYPFFFFIHWRRVKALNLNLNLS